MSNKIYGISLARLVATIMIFSCHIFQFYGNKIAWWLNCGVNCFLIISGFLYGKKEYSFGSIKDLFDFSLKFYCKEFLKILFPLFLHIVICIPIYVMKGTSVIDLLKLFLLKNSGISGFGYMWYFKYILVCYAFLPLYYLFPEKKYKTYLLVFVFSIFLVFSKGDLVWYACFLLGILLSRIYNHKYYCFLNIVMTIISLILIYVCLVYNVDRTNMSFVLNVQKLTLGYCIVVLCLSLLDNKSINDKVQKMLNYSDKVSYSVFLTHPLFISGELSILNISNSTFINVLLCISFVLVYSYLFKELYLLLHKHLLFCKCKIVNHSQQIVIL